MSGNRRTRDGIRLSRIERMARQIAGVSTRQGTNHPIILNYPNMEPCPIAESTDVRRMVVPWFGEITGYNNQNIYQSFQRGRW